MTLIRFHPEVYKDVASAYDWYESYANGLGNDFTCELELGLESIASMPEAWSKFGRKFRRFHMSRFPFAIVYSFGDQCVYVLAVMHQRRKPDFWKSRI